MQRSAVDVFPHSLKFKILTFNQLEQEYSDLIEKTAKEVDLNTSEKIAFVLRPLLRRKLKYISTGMYFTIFFFVYCCVCAIIFIWCEAQHYNKMQNYFSQQKYSKRIELFQQFCTYSELCNTTLLFDMVDQYEAFLNQNSFQFRDENNPWAWTFSHTFGFVIWVYSTIGDGKMYPATPIGRIACIVLSLLGIPLFLLVIAYQGRAINEFFKLVYNKRNFIYRYPSIATPLSNLDYEKTNPTVSMTKSKSKSGTPEKIKAPVNLRFDNEDFTILFNGNTSGRDNKISLPKTLINYPHLGLRGKFPEHISILPPTVAFLILFFYMLIGATILSQEFKDWNFLTCFYYLHVTLTTIGFGDVDPWRHFTIAHYFYVFIGTAMFAMVLESMKESIRENFRTGMRKILLRIKVIPLKQDILLVPYDRSLKKDGTTNNEVSDNYVKSGSISGEDIVS